MTIKSDKSKVTLDFECEINKETYLIKFHYTEELGQTVSICDNAVSTVYTGYPVDLFTEIVDFLRLQKVIGHSTNIVPSMSKDDMNVIVNEEASSLLPMPKINDDIEKNNSQEEIVESMVVTGDPVQSFSSTKTINSKKKQEVSTREEVVKNDLDANDTAIIEERKLAAEKAANAPKKSVKRIDEEE